MAYTILFVALLAGGAVASRQEETEMRMPQVLPNKADIYLCRGMTLDQMKEHYLIKFQPHGSMHTAHHMILYGCAEPGTDQDVWDCGEMKEGESSQYESGPVCQSGSQIIYAWAMDAPDLKLPEGVGFKVGGQSPIQHLVLQIHYMHKLEKPDSSGMTLVSTTNKMPKSASTLLMVTDGVLPPKSKENFDTACEIDEDVELHPFAFRTHTHKHGKVVSGWLVSREDDKKDQWKLIGKRDPQQPQMFYPTADKDMVVRQGDVLAARCVMTNEGDSEVLIGPHGSDEMCNFYMMYWVEGDDTLTDNTCMSPGPSKYYWEKEAGLTNIPEKESTTL